MAAHRLRLAAAALLLAAASASTTTDPLSTVATFILRSLLAECDGVTVDVRGAHKIPQGAVDGVRIEGRSWCSRGGLRCRELAMEVGAARIDGLRLLTSRQIAFVEAVQGEAVITFDAADFEAFVQHPLVGPSAVWSRGAARGAPAAPARAEPPFRFGGGDCSIDASGALFCGEWRGRRRALRLVAAGPAASGSPGAPPRGAGLPIDVLPVGASASAVQPEGDAGSAGADAAADELAGLLRLWFRDLKVDLDGALLGPIRELSTDTVPPRRAAPGAPLVAGGSPVIRLRMGLSVRHFPSLPPKF